MSETTENKQSKFGAFFNNLGNAIVKFFREIKSEIKKIVWPTPKQTANNTLAVIVCVAIVGGFVSALEVLFTYGWQQILNLI